MSSMFNNYNTQNLANYVNIDSYTEQTASGLKNLYDKKQRFYGVEAHYQMPFDLYFHLVGDTEALSVSDCIVELSICTRPANKVIFTKIFSGKEVFNTQTFDVKLNITQDEASQLKQETYNIILKLIHTTGTYIVHTEHDGVLVVK
jgi:hypothetical protein